MSELQLLSAKEVAEMLHIGASGVRKLAREEKIPHFKKFGRVLFNKDEVTAWLQTGKRGEKSLEPTTATL